MKKIKSKRVIIALLCLVMASMCLSSCGSSEVTGGGILLENFAEINWMRPIEGCSEVIYFAQDETIHYYEVCGNPVGDMDLYENYYYDVKTGVITVTSPWGEKDMIVKVVNCEDDRLVLDFDGEQREFQKTSSDVEIAD